MLGKPRLICDGRDIAVSWKRRTFPLFALLLLQRGAAIRRDDVAFRLWPDARGDAGRSDLRRHLQYLDRTLCDAGIERSPIVRDGALLRIDRASAPWVDALAFEDASAGNGRLEEAAALYRGDLLEPFADDWIVEERQRLRSLHLANLERLVAGFRAAGDRGSALRWALELQRLEPFREDLVRAVMALRSELGDSAGALRTYADFSRLLQAELEVVPMDETAALHAQLQRRNAATTFANALPVENGAFFGREAELARLAETLAGGRLLTLTGPPGVGKTRTAVRLAREARPLPDGAFFVDLTEIAQPDAVERTIVASLAPSAAISLEDAVRGRTMLLVLDGCEHLRRECARVVERALRAAPHSTILATGRSALGLAGETAWPLEPLGPSEAAALFRDRALAARPDAPPGAFSETLVAAVCARLDGLPLALELAAARLRTMPLAEVARRLEEGFELLGRSEDSDPSRHATLEATFAWSYRLLEDADRRLFARLSVLGDGFTPAAAAAVDGANEWETLERLNRLVDHSLVVAPPAGAAQTRYRMLHSTRTYAAGRLLAAGDRDAVRERHARYYVALYAGTLQRMRGPLSIGSLDDMDADVANLRDALVFMIDESRDLEAGMALALPLARHWVERNRSLDVPRYLRAALDGGAGTPEMRAEAFYRLATMLRHVRDYAANAALFERARDSMRDLGDARGFARASVYLSEAERLRGNMPRARELGREALDTFRELGERYGEAYALTVIAFAELNLDEYEASREAFTEALAIFTELDAESDRALALTNLANVYFNLGEFETASELVAQSLARQRNLRNPYGIAHALVALAMNAFAGGDRSKAREHVREAMSLAASLHDVDISMMALETAAYVAADETPSLARSWLSTLEIARERYGRALSHDLGRHGQKALDDALREALGAPGDRAARVRGRISPLEDAIAEASAAI
jgi:predicted ATPase/DNA-binding SARP family transcriptional activator